MLAILMAAAILGQVPEKAEGTIRVATFNTSLNRDTQGGLIATLASPADPQAKNVAEVLQRVRPDVVLLNEFDFDPEQRAIRFFQRNYLSVSQNGAEPIAFRDGYMPTVNTGLPSRMDLDNDGMVGREPGSRAYGNDALGYGVFPGQYGMVLLTQFPVVDERILTFQDILWKDMPGARLPINEDGSPWFTPEELEVVRLSSKSHCDVPIDVNGEVLHVLISHPTPPAFDGPEKRNQLRNHDEIRLWVDYIGGGEAARYLFAGKEASRPESFVILGDLNADPKDGSGDARMIRRLIDHERVAKAPAPRSEGAKAAAASQGGRNAGHQSSPENDTADFDDRSVGNLRVDYVLPSSDWEIVDCGVFWPVPGDPLERLVAMDPVATSDHRLVWVDLRPKP